MQFLYNHNQLLKWLVLLALLLAIVSFLSFWFGSPSFSESGVKLEIEGPNQVSVGDEVIYKLKYSNDTKLDLNNMTFKFIYPDDSVVLKDGVVVKDLSETFTLDQLSPGQEAEREFKAFLVGDRGNIKTAKVEISYKGKSMTFKMIDTPGITTRVDYEDFLKYKVNQKEAKIRAKEATQGIIESIKWLDDMDVVVIVLDATENPYNQVNITIIGNLVARKIPVLIVANKSDLRKANVKKIEEAFPEYPVIGMSAKYGKNLDGFYDEIFKLAKKVR